MSDDDVYRLVLDATTSNPDLKKFVDEDLALLKARFANKYMRRNTDCVFTETEERLLKEKAIKLQAVFFGKPEHPHGSPHAPIPNRARQQGNKGSRRRHLAGVIAQYLNRMHPGLEKEREVLKLSQEELSELPQNLRIVAQQAMQKWQNNPTGIDLRLNQDW